MQHWRRIFCKVGTLCFTPAWSGGGISLFNSRVCAELLQLMRMHDQMRE
jgi:hypothetical protein